MNNRTRCSLWWNQTGQWCELVWSTPKTKLRCCDWLDLVRSVIKTRQDNNMIDRIGMIYVEDETKLLWLMGLGVIYYENQMGQWCDQSYRKTMWPMVDVRYTLKMILNFHNRSNWVQSVIKTRQDNDVTDRIGVHYVENKTELSWTIRWGVVCDKNQTREWCDR